MDPVTTMRTRGQYRAAPSRRATQHRYPPAATHPHRGGSAYGFCSALRILPVGRSTKRPSSMPVTITVPDVKYG